MLYDLSQIACWTLFCSSHGVSLLLLSSLMLHLKCDANFGCWNKWSSLFAPPFVSPLYAAADHILCSASVSVQVPSLLSILWPPWQSRQYSLLLHLAALSCWRLHMLHSFWLHRIYVFILIAIFTHFRFWIERVHSHIRSPLRNIDCIWRSFAFKSFQEYHCLRIVRFYKGYKILKIHLCLEFPLHEAVVFLLVFHYLYCLVCCNTLNFYLSLFQLYLLTLSCLLEFWQVFHFALPYFMWSYKQRGHHVQYVIYLLF